MHAVVGWLVVGWSRSWTAAKQCVVGLWLPLNTNRKPYHRNSMIPFSTPFCDPLPGIWAPISGILAHLAVLLWFLFDFLIAPQVSTTHCISHNFVDNRLLDFLSRISRDQPNSREKMHDFTIEFLKCAKFHGKFTEGVWKIHGPHSRYFEVLCQCKLKNLSHSTY